MEQLLNDHHQHNQQRRWRHATVCVTSPTTAHSAQAKLPGATLPVPGKPRSTRIAATTCTTH
jgi:hypothetical protein